MASLTNRYSCLGDGARCRCREVLVCTGAPLLVYLIGLGAYSQMAGLIALSDPPRDDSAALISELAGLGVRTIMVTGDAPVTAQVVAGAIGIAGPVWGTTPLPADLQADKFSIFAGVLPEDKYQLVKALQKSGHIVGMCGDGANDAPALRQAQMGIAVSTATDVAKSAAGIDLLNAEMKLSSLPEAEPAGGSELIHESKR